MEIRFGDISSIPIQIARESEAISNNNSNNDPTLAVDKSNSAIPQHEDKDKDKDGDEKKKMMMKKTESQLYSKQVVEMEVKPRTKKRRISNKSAKIIPSLAQIERVTGKTKKGLPACFVGAKREDW